MERVSYNTNPEDRKDELNEYFEDFITFKIAIRKKEEQIIENQILSASKGKKLVLENSSRMSR